jgi:hypothetical protein
MFKKVTTVLFVITLVFSMSVAGFAQGATKKEAHLEGKVVRSNKDKSTLTLGVGPGGRAEKIVYYDDSTKWESQYHGDKKVNVIDASQVKDGDYVICMGNNEKGEFHATTISKRLSHSPSR